MPTDRPASTSPGRDPAARSAGARDRTGGPALLALCGLLALLGLFPPETRGESWIGGSLLIALVVLLLWRRPLPVGARALVLAVPLVAWIDRWTSVAPGEALEPTLLVLLAATLGAHIGGLPAPARGGTAVPWTMALTGAAVAVHGLFQVSVGLEADAAWLERVGAVVPEQAAVLTRLSRGRAFAAFPTPAALACYLAITLPVTLALARSGRGRGRWAPAGLALLQFAGLLASTSVTAAAALAVATGLALLVRRATRRVALVAVLLAAATLTALVAVRSESILDLRHERNPLRLRAGNFRIAAQAIRDHPWLGVGLGAYAEVFPAYRDADDNQSRHAHDLPLELAAELGIPLGLLAGGVFFVLFLGPLLRRRTGTGGWQEGLAVGLAAFALHNLVDFTAFLPSVLWTAAAGRGLLAAAPRGEQPVRPLRAAVTLILALLAATLGVATGVAREVGYRARLSAVAGDVASAEALGERAARLAPWDADWQLFLAQARLDLDDVAGAREAVGRAVDLLPRRAAARAVRARVRLRDGDVPGAFVDLDSASRLHPADARYTAARDDLEARLPRRRATGEGLP